MNVLAIDSSNITMGIAIANQDIVLGELITNVKKNHSVKLMPAIEYLMNETQLKPEEIDRIVVATGPGSYTGVRIGVTIAKTLAWTLKKELVGVSSLELLAQNGRFFNGFICPLFDARRGRVYTGLYRSKNGDIIKEKEDTIIQLSDWLNMLNDLDQPILFLGNDVRLYEHQINECLGKENVETHVTKNQSSPSELAWLGMRKRPVTSIHNFVPTYLQLAEAETKWLAKQEGK
ncbi:tRNA threonylcarbamoyladenosine biosynthesis protein TsaB [Pullulanibacillus pueri]|uniref:tRNA (Adenosine(37)-N6)-threonylcarbamoyltransferase complex dimerization subunit type 1 TsaB n=1 Tax=Pullulanibacillus pueri TaxID=1437324 RepID=A0A8J3EN54_9BACL|nr:tRNA (adenosine(37)-N6)-threonylcarbamoyltransferase complex dimerization subunit type 1 TsaB [Pullulanibacillus pueri]MBM7682838.1 tRNA threonylcarbamoyladenosine biosynthesis protein TsaB [Pullulanibacillus pueri]GGH83393.1 tRNA (adenosine(37)-N6)-threonylcarbamoyltransferase complex dimerization subunit type 1 TsaB [Pullulanibacillus pueri]